MRADLLFRKLSSDLFRLTKLRGQSSRRTWIRDIAGTVDIAPDGAATDIAPDGAATNEIACVARDRLS